MTITFSLNVLIPFKIFQTFMTLNLGLFKDPLHAFKLGSIAWSEPESSCCVIVFTWCFLVLNHNTFVSSEKQLFTAGAIMTMQEKTTKCMDTVACLSHLGL